MYERLPLDFIGITGPFGNGHYGIDLGWDKYQGEPVYAVYDSEVVYEGYDNNLGNYVVLKYDIDNSTIINRFLHLKERTTLKIGDKVKQKQVIGYMGTTGDSTGTHLHFEYWICPKGYNYSYLDREKYAKNPIDYCYLFDDQSAGKSYDLLRKVRGFSEKIDKTKDQAQVINKYLHIRTDPSLTATILGFVNLGYYNIIDTKVNDGYTWYKILNDKWIANTEDVIYHKKEEEKDKYKEFICPKDGIYYIRLKKGEKVFYPK